MPNPAAVAAVRCMKELEFRNLLGSLNQEALAEIEKAIKWQIEMAMWQNIARFTPYDQRNEEE